ncbi:hypothetical protein CANARDRAFT_26552 [[Candida] arabinofermentans NRRL YB-2248]|uniref:Phosphatidate cytidylyltransferase, mitochondrial n=1 Tax=[Candida] arabinofermentans NRRL YB-2248 TaxID=983967 RepID=A0A1E4T5T7_9ASCO|nr:hypothetical protein CANARDRAFT_26552 [[Candida] arabinofermentans NRRL YB-2248]
MLPITKYNNAFNSTRLISIQFNRFKSSKISTNESQSKDSSIFSSTTDEIDPVLLDKLFRKNKPKSTSSIYRNVSFTKRHELLNIQEPKKFSVLDENLLKLKTAPINFNYYLRNIEDLRTANQLPYKFGSNQLISNDSKMDQFLKKILWEFNAPVRFSFGYGSKVFSQGLHTNDLKNSQIDMIFAVSYPDHWHSLNLNQFPNHYSNLKYFGSNIISKIGDLGAGVYFNPFVKMNIQDYDPFELKYGVTSIDNLMNDLINWDTMYLSGRLHKPVAIIRNSPNISLLNQYNLVNTIKLSILLLDLDEITESQLYYKIASLSYIGDPRFKIGGENPNKVNNIVNNQFDKFREMYLPLLDNYFPKLIQRITPTDSKEHKFKINKSIEAKSLILVDLPKSFRKKILSKYTSKYENEYSKDIFSQNVINSKHESFKKLKKSELSFLELQTLAKTLTLKKSELNILELKEKIPIEDWEYLPNETKIHSNEFIKSIASDVNLVNALESSVKETVSKPSLIQSMKGILTAGLGKSWKYAIEKRKKYESAK